MRRLVFLCKDPASHTGSCPALYGVQDDAVTRAGGVLGHVVQGKTLGPGGWDRRDPRPGSVVYGRPVTADERAQLRDLAPDEDAVWVPDAGLDVAARDDRAEFRPPTRGEAAVWVPADLVARLEDVS
jgi:hypothetical protein